MISRRMLSPLDYLAVAAEVTENLWYLCTVAGLTLTLILGEGGRIKVDSYEKLVFTLCKTCNNNLLNHDSLSKIVKRQIREITIVNENKITRKNREIVNKYCEKIFKFGYDKRVIKHVDENHIDTLPYGY